MTVLAQANLRGGKNLALLQDLYNLSLTSYVVTIKTVQKLEKTMTINGLPTLAILSVERKGG